MKTVEGALALCFVLACGDSEPPNLDAPMAPGETASILSAYHGLDALPAAAMILCGGPAAVGEDGMPVVFSVQIEPDSVSPEAFVVETATGERVTPVCATLRPANESLENRTVLLAGAFGGPDATPASVEVVGDLRAADGNSLMGLRTQDVVPLSSGPSIVLAERFVPDAIGLAGECPEGTAQVVQLTWNGGVSGPEGAALGEAQRQGVSVVLESGATVTPIALADDDPDNHVHACLAEASPATRVRVAAGLFHDPGDDANAPTSIEVVPGVR